MNLSAALALLASALPGTAVVLAKAGVRCLDLARLPSIAAMRGMPSRDLCVPVGED
jgi:hypothetical protein